MAKAKKNSKITRQKRVRRAPIPRALRLTPTGASLAAYHAALSDPFASPPTFIPIGSRPGTFVHKRLVTTVADAGVTNFAIRLWTQGPNEWKIGFYAGVSDIRSEQLLDAHGKMRIVGAAVRVTDIGKLANMGGLATLANTSSLLGTHDHESRVLFRKSATVHYKPIFPSDFVWFGGNEGSDNDGYGDISREISINIDAAVESKTFVEFVVLFENDEQFSPIEGAANYLVGRRVHTHDGGPEAKQVAHHAVAGHKQREVDMRNHNAARGPSYIQRLAEGVKAAAETGATVMGVVENLAPGALSGPFKEYLGLGAATEAEMVEAASDALPMLEAAMDFAPMAIMGL